MDDGDLTSLIEGLSQQGQGSGQLLLTHQNHYVVSNSIISTDTPFPTPSPSPSIVLRSPAAVPPASPGTPAPSPARPNTPQPSITQYSSIAPNTSQLVQLFQNQSNTIVGRAHMIQATNVQTSSLKGKQPQQILPKPLPPGVTGTKQTVTRISPSLSQQATPLLINQTQHQNPTLLLNQVLTSGGPMLVQQAGGGGTVHLMLRPPNSLQQSGPGPPQGKMVLGNPSPQPPTVLIQQNRQQVMRIMTAQGPMQMQLQQIQTPTGPQIIAIPANQAVSLPTNTVLVQGSSGTIHLQPAQPSLQLQPMPQPQVTPPQVQVQAAKPKKSSGGGGGKRPKPIKARSDSSASPPSSREDLSPSRASPKVSGRHESVMSSPMSSPTMVSLAAPAQKNVTSSLRQIRPTAFARKQNNDGSKEGANDGGKSTPSPAIDNLTATINSVAANIKSPSHDESPGQSLGEVLSGTQNLNLNKRPNLTIFQKNRPEDNSGVRSGDSDRTPPPSNPTKKPANKKKGKKDENKVDLWDLMKSAGIGVEEFEETGVSEIGGESLEIAADSELLAQLQSSHALQIPGGLRLALGEDGRPVIIDGNNILIPDVAAAQQGTQTAQVLTPTDSAPLLNLTPQALATAQHQLTQLLQDHGTITPADQQLLTQIFTVNPSQGLAGLSNIGMTQTSASGQQTLCSGQQSNVESVVVSNRSTETDPPPSPVQATPEPPPPPPKVEAVAEFLGGPPPGLPPLGPDSLVITNNNGVPTLVASPALLQYLQTHQGIIQFQHDPVTKTIQPSLIIPHPQHTIQQSAQQQSINEPSGNDKSPRLQQVMSKDGVVGVVKGGVASGQLESGQTSLANILRNQTVPSGVKQSMARMIQENPSLLQVARDTSSLITYKESCPNLSEAEIADIDRKIQTNKNLLDQCFHMEMEKGGASIAGGKENLVFQVAGTQTLQDINHLDMNMIKKFQGPPSTNSPTANSDFQNKFLESIGMMTNAPVVIAKPAQPTQPAQSQPAKKSRKKKTDKVPEVQQQPVPQQTTQPQTKKLQNQVLPPVGNLTFNIKQLTPEQNERLNIALSQRGVTANRAALCEMTDLEKQIIEEEIRKVTGGTLGNATLKFFTPNTAEEPPKVHAPQLTSVRYYTEDDSELTPSSAMVLNNPNLNQLLDSTGGSQIVSLGNPIHSGNQVLTLGSPPPPGSVIVGSNGQVVAYVQAPARPTLQLTANKQQMLKSVQMQMQVITSKPTRTASDVATLDKLMAEQQKILQSGKLINPPQHQPQPIQILSQSGVGQRVIQTSYVQGKATATMTQAISCGTSTADMPSLAATSPGNKGGKPETSLQYGPLYVSPGGGKLVTKCEKGTSPIQIQMGTQTTQGSDFRGSKMSTGTMTSPNTGKPQAVVAPAIVHSQPSEQPLNNNSSWVKQPRRCPSPVLTVSKTTLIEKQMLVDETGAARPDTHTPFLSTSDAVKRLVRYHVMDEKGLSTQDLQAADDMFETTATHLLDKFRLMKDKYKYLLLMETMREVSTAERIMVDRNFIIEERIELEELREKEKRTQEEFENPPPPIPTPIPAPPLTPSLPLPQPPLKTDDILAESVLMELESELESDSDSLSPFKVDLDDSTKAPESTDISAQVQSAIDSILNLRQSEDPEERRKRKRQRPGSGTSQVTPAPVDTARKRGRKRDGDAEVDGNGDPVLDEAIRSILSS